MLRRATDANAVGFTVNGVPLDRVTSFRYLGRELSFNNSDWPALFRQLQKARQRWGLLSRVLEHQGASIRAKGLFYKTIVMSVLLYGSETWVVTDTMLKVLESFHHRAARRLTGRMARRIQGVWVYPGLAKTMRKAGLFSIKEYIRRRQAHLEQHIALRPIHNLCTQAETRTGSASRVLRWWQQDHNAPEPLEASGSDSDTTNNGG